MEKKANDSPNLDTFFLQEPTTKKKNKVRSAPPVTKNKKVVKNINLETVEKDNMRLALHRELQTNILGFQKKYKINSLQDIINATNKLQNKDSWQKFSKFIQYFNDSDLSKKVKRKKSEEPQERDETKMLSEIAGFVESKDFKRFFSKCKV